MYVSCVHDEIVIENVENKRNSYFVVIKISDDIKHEILIGEERFEKAGMPGWESSRMEENRPVPRAELIARPDRLKYLSFRFDSFLERIANRSVLR